MRFRIVQLLGRLGRLNRYLIVRPEGEALIAWDTEKRMRFDFPFREANISIHLGI